MLRLKRKSVLRSFSDELRLMLRYISQSVCLLLLAIYLTGCNRSPSGSTSQTDVSPNDPSEKYLSLMNAGKNYLDRGDATNALATYKEAAALVPNDPDVHLNLANGYLLSDAGAEAIRETTRMRPIPRFWWEISRMTGWMG